QQPLGQIGDGGVIAGRTDHLAHARANAGDYCRSTGQRGDPVHSAHGYAEPQSGDGDGVEEGEGEDRANDIFIQWVAVVLLLDYRTRMDELLEVGLEQDVGNLEAEDLQAACGGAGAAADKAQVEEHHAG